jgi:hypothetical protein
MLAIGPAGAQFGQIFGSPPPRPPGNVPSRPPAAPTPAPTPAPLGLPQEMPPEEMDDDAAPPPPPAPRAALPQPGQPGTAARPPIQQPPPGGAIRSQPLAPPPGTAVAPRPGVPPAANLQPGQAVPPAQPGVPGQRPPGTANTAPQPPDEVITELPSQKIANPTAVFAGLDKITGRIISFEVALNEKVQFGALQVTPRICYTRPPTETTNTDSFVEVDEVTLQGEVKRLFTGWMFAVSPGLHAVEHPIYDVWLTDCKGGTTVMSDAQPNAAPAPGQRPAGVRPPVGAAGGGATAPAATNPTAGGAAAAAGAVRTPPAATRPPGTPSTTQQAPRPIPAVPPPPGLAPPRQ